MFTKEAYDSKQNGTRVQGYGNLLFVGRTRQVTQQTAKAVCETGISPLEKIPTPCALKASFQIFRWRKRTHIQNTSVLSVFDVRTGHKKEKQDGCPAFFFGDPNALISELPSIASSAKFSYINVFAVKKQ